LRRRTLVALGGTALSAATPRLPAEGGRELTRFVAEEVARGAVPGAVVLVTAPEGVLYHEAFGLINTAQGVKMRPDAIFRIASMTKALTSAAVLMLVDEGKLALDDDVAKYLPAFRNPPVIRQLDLAAGKYETRPAARPITVRQLLTHTSGIGYAWSDPGLAMIEKQMGGTNDSGLPLVHEPGERWTYGASTKALGDLIAQLSGQPFETFLAARVLQPLGMRDTGYQVTAAMHARVVTLHERREGMLAEQPNPAVIEAAPRGDGRLFSTAADYAQFVRLILNRGRVGGPALLRAETVAQMGRNHIGSLRVQRQPVANTSLSRPYPTGAGEDVWGLGFQLAQPAMARPDRRRPGSMSWAGINNTFYWIDPQARIGVIVLMQLLPFYDEAAMAVLDGVETRVYRHLRR